MTPAKSYVTVLAIAPFGMAPTTPTVTAIANTEIEAFITLPIGLRCFNQ
jgi:hypothetical protein